MRTPSSKAFILSAAIYGLVVSGGYWLFTQDLQAYDDQTGESLKEVAVSLSMFQPPVEKTVEPIEKPKEKVIKPEAIKTEETPKPIPKPTPKPTIVEPVPEFIEEVVEEIVEAPVEVVEAPQPAPKQPTAEVIPQVIKPQFSQQQVATAEQRYLTDLRDQIAEHARNTYPKRAKRRHWEGSVTLEFTLLANGQIKGLKIASSSGRQILDDAATTILQSKMNSQFKPFPAEIQRKTWRIKLPVGYHLTP